MDDQYFVEATIKDYQYYAPFFKKTLEGKLRQNEKWRKITEANMQKVENPSKEVYEELQKRIDRYVDNIASLCEKIGADMDESNPELAEYVKEQLYFKEKQRVNNVRKKNAVAMAKKEMQETLSKKYEEERSFRRKDNYQKKSMDISYRRMMEVEETLPSYIHSALAKLPNHKGYIFRGVWYFGKLPSNEHHFISMMERSQNKNLCHEYYYDGRGRKWYQCFERASNGQRTLLCEREYYNSRYIF